MLSTTPRWGSGTSKGARYRCQWKSPGLLGVHALPADPSVNRFWLCRRVGAACGPAPPGRRTADSGDYFSDDVQAREDQQISPYSSTGREDPNQSREERFSEPAGPPEEETGLEANDPSFSDDRRKGILRATQGDRGADLWNYQGGTGNPAGSTPRFGEGQGRMGFDPMGLST